jgi:hypothetical protein
LPEKLNRRGAGSKEPEVNPTLAEPG